VLRFYHAYHRYVARNVEEYFCPQNSLAGSFDMSDCTIRSSFANDTHLRTWIFEQARRSTIRFSQALLEQAALHILLINEDGSIPEEEGKFDALFEHYFSRDRSAIPVGVEYYDYTPQASVREHQEWLSDITRNHLHHHAISGLDHLISLRNPTLDTTAVSLLASLDCEAGDIVNWDAIDRPLAEDVIQLLHTKLRTFGSTIDSSFQRDVAIALHRTAELGLGYYLGHVAQLTNSPSTSGPAANLNVYYGAQIESSSDRQYQFSKLASVVMASIVPINDVLMADKSSYWQVDSNGLWTARDQHYHPESPFIVLNDLSNCYQEEEGVCTDASKNAAGLVVGNRDEYDDGSLENPAQWRSPGLTFSSPDRDGIVNYWLDIVPFSTRQVSMFRLLSQFTNTILYQWDGLKSYAVKQANSEVNYLPNQVIDAIPTNIAWLDAEYDGFCFCAAYNCSRSKTLAIGTPATSSECPAVPVWPETELPEGTTCYWQYLEPV